MANTKKKSTSKTTAETQPQEGDTGLQTPLPDQPIETPTEEPTPTESDSPQPDESPEQPQVEQAPEPEPAPESQRAQRLATRDRIQSLGANQQSAYDARQAELDAAREEHNRRVATV